jgi:hypothetical protein
MWQLSVCLKNTSYEAALFDYENPEEDETILSSQTKFRRLKSDDSLRSMEKWTIITWMIEDVRRHGK